VANVCDGRFKIVPVDETTYQRLKNVIEPNERAFSYHGDVDFYYVDQTLEVFFTGRWRCDDAWDALDAMMEANDDKLLATSLISASIKGVGREGGCHYRAKVLKDSGACKLRRFLKKRYAP
jgi:hypothetical protein